MSAQSIFECAFVIDGAQKALEEGLPTLGTPQLNLICFGSLAHGQERLSIGEVHLSEECGFYFRGTCGLHAKDVIIKHQFCGDGDERVIELAFEVFQRRRPNPHANSRLSRLFASSVRSPNKVL